TDPARFRELSLSVVDKFPGTPTAAEALYHVAESSAGPERRSYFEKLRATYPPDTFSYGASAMYDFYDDVTTPSDALSIAQGQPAQAYASLVESAAAAPDERVEAALQTYAKALNKSADDVAADIWRIRDTNAVPAAPFELSSDRGGAPVKLSDYRGKVVLLAF